MRYKKRNIQNPKKLLKGFVVKTLIEKDKAGCQWTVSIYE